MGKILNRYVFLEILVPFFFGLAVFTFVLLIARILKLVELVVNRGVPLLDILKTFSLILPAFLEVTVPMDQQGDVMGDLNSRRGRVQGTEPGNNGEQIITALVPTSEIMRYAIDLRSITGGRGRFTVQHDHYDLLPQHLTDKIAKTKADAEKS